MTNEQIIAECEKTLGLKIVEDIYPNCIYFIIIKFENGKMLSLDKMSNGGTAKGRRTFTNKEQMKEIKARCEDFIASSQNKTFWERYRDGDIRHIHISDNEIYNAFMDALVIQGKRICNNLMQAFPEKPKDEIMALMFYGEEG